MKNDTSLSNLDLSQLQLDANWENDCQGKKDYDGDIISISTRYWPAGGGFTLMRNNGGIVEILNSEEIAPETKHSAYSSLNLYYNTDKYTPPDGICDLGCVTLIDKNFEADTEDEVRQQAEDWANNQFKIVAELIVKHYKAKQ